MEKNFKKILYSFIETCFLTNENPYKRSLSLRRHTLSLHSDCYCSHCSLMSICDVICSYKNKTLA